MNLGICCVHFPLLSGQTVNVCTCMWLFCSLCVAPSCARGLTHALHADTVSPGSGELVVKPLIQTCAWRGRRWNTTSPAIPYQERSRVNKAGVEGSRPSQTATSLNKDQVDRPVVDGSLTWMWNVACGPRQGERSYLLPSTLSFSFITWLWPGTYVIS